MPAPQPADDALALQVRDRVLSTMERLLIDAPNASRRADDVPAPDRESLALRRVFSELGLAQRRRRHELGLAPSPAVRTAARAFRRHPSLEALIGVAGALRTAGLLA